MIIACKAYLITKKKKKMKYRERVTAQHVLKRDLIIENHQRLNLVNF